MGKPSESEWSFLVGAIEASEGRARGVRNDAGNFSGPGSDEVRTQLDRALHALATAAEHARAARAKAK